MQIAIIGLGYVGLPLALQFARSGVSVVGLDIDSDKVDSVRNGRSYIRHIEHADLKRPIDDGTLVVFTDFTKVWNVRRLSFVSPLR